MLCNKATIVFRILLTFIDCLYMMYTTEEFVFGFGKVAQINPSVPVRAWPPLVQSSKGGGCWGVRKNGQGPGGCILERDE